MEEQEKHFIEIAIEEAKNATWPFGAVIVRKGEIISKAGSGDGEDIAIDPTAHAEVNAIRRACQSLNTGDLSGSVLYASCEPCALCVGAAWYAGIKEIVFGTNLADIQDINKAWGGDLVFPHDHLDDTGIQFRGSVLKDQVMEMYQNHSKIRNIL